MLPLNVQAPTSAGVGGGGGGGGCEEEQRRGGEGGNGNVKDITRDVSVFSIIAVCSRSGGNCRAPMLL
jgi:hypothetical protein